MLLALTFLTLLIRIPYSFTTILTCVPNSYFILNGQLCYCNSLGQANQATCQLIGRRQECYPGQIIWEECRQCICQENGNILCTNIECAEERSHKKKSLRIGSEIWCTPFRSYYFNCTLCVCPASGKISEGRCVKDSSCVLKGHHTSYDTILQHICKPKVIYLFTCLQCICSDDGIFLSSQCNETCHKRPESTKHCIPGSFYKNDCNICHCPETGIPDSNACTKLTCTKNFKLTNISAIRNSTSSCISNKFTRPKCMYCECNSQGHVNELACMEQECLKIGDYKYDSVRVTCSSGEMVPTCMECFCPRTKLTEEKYCTKVCSYQNKIAILENVLKEKIHLIDRTILKETSGTDTCESNGLFLDQGRYCLCSEEGNTEVKYCTSVVEYTTPKKPSKFRAINNLHTQQEIDGNASCEPNTYVEFGCNFCYCVKNGKIDRKWCTNDNCKIKNIIHENLKGRADSLPQNTFAGTKCVPGSVTKNNCNFCICGSSGLLADSACTKDDCDSQYTPTDELNCEPSSYYTVDCNVCLCPSDGIKNVDKCTRNQCENNFLRSQICSPGEFFSDDCNICICPSNGKKKDKICTNRTCSANDTPWKNLFRISQSLLKSRDETSVSSQNYQSCFPGEEYELGCKVCVCPDMGLKTYATCSDSLCDEQFSTTPIYEEVEEERTDHFKEDRKYNINELPIYELANRRAYNSYINEDGEMCRIYNLTESSERDDCTPGSEYIIRCRICICPYMGSIDNFCRPMPPDRYCEMAFPGYNFVPMGRRNENEKRNSNTTTAAIKIKYPIQIHLPHNHTRYRCDKPGRLKDKCYICDCKDNVIIEEHCFKSDADDCKDITMASFIKIENKLHDVYTLLLLLVGLYDSNRRTTGTHTHVYSYLALRHMNKYATLCH